MSGCWCCSTKGRSELDQFARHRSTSFGLERRRPYGVITGTDFIVMVDQTSQMLATGPEAIKTVTGVTLEELGGGRTHNSRTTCSMTSFCEVQPLFAQNIVCGFGRAEGRSIGVVADQPMVLTGCLDIDASEKAARFVRFCDCFNIPVLAHVRRRARVPAGHRPGVEGHHPPGARLLYAYAEATVPLLAVITRKAYGVAYE